MAQTDRSYMMNNQGIVFMKTAFNQPIYTEIGGNVYVKRHLIIVNSAVKIGTSVLHANCHITLFGAVLIHHTLKNCKGRYGIFITEY